MRWLTVIGCDGFVGFYTDQHSCMSKYRMDSISSLSTHDCTIDSVETPSPIILNNNSLSDLKRNAFVHQGSLGSDSVFSSTEDSSTDRQVLTKLESIQEKFLHEMDDKDLEDGIGISFDRQPKFYLERQASTQSDGDIPSAEIPTVEQKRNAFSRMKSISYDEEMLSKLLHEKLTPQNNCQNQKGTTPIIVKTEHVDMEPTNSKLLPQQVEGLLQVIPHYWPVLLCI